MSYNRNTLPLIGCVVALSFGAWAARASLDNPPTTYNLIGPQNGAQFAHPNGGDPNPNGGASLDIASIQTNSNPVNPSDTQTVTGSLTAKAKPEDAFNTGGTPGKSVAIGSLFAQVQNGAGFQDGGAYAEASLTQYVRVINNSGRVFSNVSLTLDATGQVSVALASNPTYTDSFGNSGYWSGQNGAAKLSLEFDGAMVTKQVQSPLDNGGIGYSGSSKLDASSLQQLTAIVFPVNTWVPVFEDVIAQDSGSFNGTVFAQIDPIITLDPAYANDFSIEVSPLNFPAETTVPEVQPLTLICTVCIAGIILLRRRREILNSDY